MGLTSEQWILDADAAFTNKGAIAEAFVGQELLAYGSPRQAQSLYYWKRNKRGSEAEVDYIIASSGDIIPIEVKTGKGSTLKSMHSFLEHNERAVHGIRFSTQNFSAYKNIYSYPIYAISKLFGDIS